MSDCDSTWGKGLEGSRMVRRLMIKGGPGGPVSSITILPDHPFKEFAGQYIKGRGDL